MNPRRVGAGVYDPLLVKGQAGGAVQLLDLVLREQLAACAQSGSAACSGPVRPPKRHCRERRQHAGGAKAQHPYRSHYAVHGDVHEAGDHAREADSEHQVRHADRGSQVLLGSTRKQTPSGPPESSRTQGSWAELIACRKEPRTGPSM